MSSVDSNRRERGVLVMAALGTMLAPLNSTMIVVALPRILDEFGHSLAWGSWIVISYLVAMAAVQPLGGSLGDRYGRRRLFMVGLIGFAGATILAALAWRIEILIVARTVQAITGAMTIPNGMALVRTLIPPKQRGRSFGLIGAGVAVAAGLGPPIGGLLTESLGWRWIFAANILLIAPALVLGTQLPSDSRRTMTGGFDLRGATLLTGALVSLALSLTIWRLDGIPPLASPVFGTIAVLSLSALVRHVRHAEEPILNLGLFRRPGFLPAASTVLFSNMAMYTILLSIPVFLTDTGSWSPDEVGLLLASLSLQMIIFAPAGGWLADRFNRRIPSVSGTALIALGIIPFFAIQSGWDWFLYLAPLAVIGIGVGLSSAPIQTAAIEAATANETGQAAGLFSTMRYLGSITGTAGMAAILAGTQPPVRDFRILYVALFLAASCAVFASSRLPSATFHRGLDLNEHDLRLIQQRPEQVQTTRLD